jgi:hypothetical protein
MSVAVALTALLATLAPAPAAPEPAPVSNRKLQELLDKVYAREYGKLAEWYANEMTEAGKAALAGGFPEQARLAWKRLEAFAPDRAAGLVIPKDLPEKNPDGAETEKVQAMRNRLQRVADDHANRLVRFAESCYTNGLVSRAYELMFEVLKHNPDHPAARKNTGFMKWQGQWVTAFAAGRLRLGMEDHPKFGWLPKASLPKYDAGQRILDGRWVTPEQERAVRGTWEKAWEIETAHYRIRTNKGLEEGVAFGRRAEELYDVFFRAFMAMNQDAFLKGDSLANYNQAAAVVLYLMHGRDARYREDFIRVIDQVYRGQGGNLDALTALLGVPAEQIEKEWIEYMKSL